MTLYYREKEWIRGEKETCRDALRDIDFWINGYRKMGVFVHLANLPSNSSMYWIVLVGPENHTMDSSFRRAISRFSSEIITERYGPYEHVIKVDLGVVQAMGTGLTSMKYQIAFAVAKELGLLDGEYCRLKEEHDQLQYHTYGHGTSHRLFNNQWGYNSSTSVLEQYMWRTIVPRIGRQLSTKRYLLVVDNHHWPINTGSLIQDCGLPPPTWTDSRWLITPTDNFPCMEKSGKGLISIDKCEHVLGLTIFALHLSAEQIYDTICVESKEYWLSKALDCFHYTMAMFANQSKETSVTSRQLIHQWAAQGIIMQPHITINQEEQEENTTISSKCSYMHRVGRVILEAFQKYSLLKLPFKTFPNYYDYTANDTGAQFLQYNGLIAQGITIDEIFDNKKKWITFSDDQGLHVTPKWLSLEGTTGTTALILRGCSQQSLVLSKLDQFLPKLCILRVLDLSRTNIKALPSSISCLLNLRLLSIRDCYYLKTLSGSSTTSATDSSTNISSHSPLSTLYKLEILDMHGAYFSYLTQDMANQKRNLIYLDMSYSNITTFPPNFFQDMSNLEELILAHCSSLMELPASMALLSNLTTLEITGTQIKYFPQKVFEEMQKLQSLKLSYNRKLISLTRQMSRMQGIKLEGHPNLVSFMLIDVPHIRCLSLRGCRKLESIEINNLGALEELDLSGTAIVEFPADIINFTQLRRLLLVGVPSLRRFPWHKLKRLPDVFYLDHCVEGYGSHSNPASQVCVSDPRFFYSFRDTAEDLVRDGRFFQSFYVRVAPCITNSRKLHDEETMLASKLEELLQKQSRYMDVYNNCYVEEVTAAPPIIVALHRRERHVEIIGMHQTVCGLENLLNVTKAISLTYDTSIKCFSHLSNFVELEECELHWCHKMEEVFYGDTDSLKKLQNVHVCNLKSLLRFCSRHSSFAFSSLKHLHLEDCPRLEHMVEHRTTLPCLKTLVILFCYSLKTIFISNHTQDDTYQLPRLQRVRLQELPLLQHMHANDATITAPEWKDLHVRGCWSLRRLPRLQGHQPGTVKLNGERSWWRKLQWGSHFHRDSYDPKLTPEFVTFDEHAEMSSYLR